MKKMMLLLIAFVLAFSTTACKNTNNSRIEGNNKTTSIESNEEKMGADEEKLLANIRKSIDENNKKLPNEISQIATVDGDLDNDIVLVNTQGGPMYELDTSTVRMMLEESVGKTEAIVVNVHQQQTLKPDDFNKKEITLEEAKVYDKKSVDDLAKVVKYFKDEGKTVYVFGMSFGAWMVQDLIANYGTEIADKFFIANGRVDMPEEIWKAFSEGGSGYFENGVKAIPNLQGTMEDPKAANDTIEIASRNISKLAAGLGHKRYTELLANTDLSKVFYLHGQKDEAVGRLTNEEVEFLKNQGATVITYNGGHSAPNDKMKEGFNFLGINLEAKKDSKDELNGIDLLSDVQKDLEGYKIAFASPADNKNGSDNEIYLMDPNGTNVDQLTSNGSDNVYPSWGPNAKYIYYVSTSHGGTYEVYRVDIKTKEETRISNFDMDVRSMAVSHDNKYLAVSIMSANSMKSKKEGLEDYSSDIYIIKMDKVEEYIKKNKLVSKENLTLLVGTPQSDHFWYEELNWNPNPKDGIATLAYSRTYKYDVDDEMYTDVWTIKADGSDKKKVVDNKNMPLWSFDGKSLSFLEFCTYSFEKKMIERMYVTDEKKELASAHISPNGKYIVFEIGDHNRRIGIARLNYNENTKNPRIFLSERLGLEPRWSPRTVD